jgi:hypothetical protein
MRHVPVKKNIISEENRSQLKDLIYQDNRNNESFKKSSKFSFKEPSFGGGYSSMEFMLNMIIDRSSGILHSV